MAKKQSAAAPAKTKAPVIVNENPVFKKIFLVLIGVLMLVIPYFSKDVGINGDERFQVYLATYVIPFYTSFGKDRRMFLTRDEVKPTLDSGGMAAVTKEYGIDIFPQASDLKNYGCGFEFTSALIAHLLGYKHDDQLGFHTVRHVLLGIITVLVILFAGLICKELLGWRAAIIGAVLLTISPGFIGQGIMNNKDSPFMLGYIIAIYFMLRFLRKLPTPDWKTAIGVIVGIAAAINIRVGGLMLIFYFGLFCILFWVYYQRIKKDAAFNSFNLKSSVIKAAVVCILGYLLGLVFFPYGLLDPISNPLEVLKTQSSFPTVINQIFEGKVVSSVDLPWYYEIKLLLMCTPLVLLLGLPLGLAMILRYRDRVHPGLAIFVIFVLVFPIFYIAYSHANVYNGWRHVLFVYPFIAVLAALGYDLLIDTFKPRAMKIGTAVVALAMCVMPASFIIAEHPHEYVYYNQPSGGVSGAFGYYTMDYYMLSAREGTDWLMKNVINKGNEKVKVITDCTYPVSVYLKNGTDKATLMPYTRYHDRSSKDWDYGIFYTEFVSPYQLQKHIWPPDGTIYEVKDEGVPICAVVKRATKADLAGHNDLQAKNYMQAITELESAKAVEPRDESVWTDLGLAYLSIGNMEKGIESLNEAARLAPDIPETAMVYYYLGMAYGQSNPPNYDYTVSYMKKALQINPNFGQAQQVLNQIQQAQGGGGGSFR